MIEINNKCECEVCTTAAGVLHVFDAMNQDLAFMLAVLETARMSVIDQIQLDHECDIAKGELH